MRITACFLLLTALFLYDCREKKRDLPEATDTRLSIADTLFENGMLFYKEKNFAQAESLFRQAAGIYAALPGTDMEWAKMRAYMARAIRVSDPENGAAKALDSLKKDLEFGRNHFPKSAGYLNFQIAYIYTAIGDHWSSLSWFEAARREHEAGHPVEKRSGTYLYHTLGNIYTRLGDYENALQTLHAAADSAIAQEDTEGVPRILADLGLAYEDQGAFDSAIVQFKRSLDYSARFPIADEEARAINRSLTTDGWARAILSRNEIDSGIALSRKALAIYPDIPEVMATLGEALFKKGEYPEAERLLQSAVDSLSKNPAPYDRSLSKALLAQVRCALDGPNPMDPLTAVNKCQKALQYVIPGYAPLTPQENPRKESLYPENTIFEALDMKSKAWWKKYGASKNPADLTASDSACALAIHMNSVLLETYGFEGSKMLSLQRMRALYEHYWTILFARKNALNEPDIDRRIVEFSEESRAILLREKLNAETALLRAPVPEALKKEETKIRNTIVACKNELAQALAGGVAEFRQTEIRQKIFQQEDTLRRLHNRLKREFPAYFNAAYTGDNGAGFADWIAAAKDPGEMCVSYFYNPTEERLFILAWSEGRIKTAVSKLSPSDVNLFLGMVRNRELGLQSEKDSAFLRDFVDQSRALYEALLAPVTAGIGVNKLIVIPDGIIGGVPFDILLPRTPEKFAFRQLPYLVRETAVSYAPSARLFVESVRRGSRGACAYFGVAPAYGGYFEMTKFGVPTVKALAQKLDGRFIAGPFADKRAFCEDADQFNVLHFYGHGKADGNRPELSYLAFSRTGVAASGSVSDTLAAGAELPAEEAGRVLFAHEIRMLRLRAELVLLSACETGIGKDAGPEGALSLARAFWDAGSNSTVMSFWSVDDRSTAFVSERFMDYIRQGLPKNEALRRAKIDFLEEGESAVPYFWAGLALTGSTRPVENLDCGCFAEIGNQSVSCMLLALTLGLLLLIAGILISIFRR